MALCYTRPVAMSLTPASIVHPDESARVGNPPGRPAWGLVAAAVACLVWLCFTGWVSWSRWDAGDIGIDSAVWMQALHEHHEGRGFRFSCYSDRENAVSRRLFSFHFYGHLHALSVLYAVIPHPLALSALVHLAHALGAFFAALLAYRLSKEDDWWAFSLACVFLLYAPLARSGLAFDYNPRHMAMLLLPMASWAWFAGHSRFALIALLLLAAGEENLALLAGFLTVGLGLWVRESCQKALITGFLLVGYTVFVLCCGLHLFMEPGTQLHFMERYTRLAEGPAGWAAALINRENGVYLLELLAPLGFLPLLALAAPTPFHLAAVPFLGQNLLSAFPSTRMIGHHYTTPLAVALLLALIVSVSGHRLRRPIGGFLLVLNLALAGFWYPILSFAWDGLDARTVQLGRSIEPLEKLVRPDDALSAPPAVCVRHWKRSSLWYFPQGMRDANLVILPRYIPGYPGFTPEELQGFLDAMTRDATARQVFQNDDFIVFRRDSAGAEPPKNR